jgi:8-oxo-dGTP diphosphatase
MSGKPFGLAVKGFVDDGKGNCLLIQRSAASKHFAGQWDLPGGKVDAGEGFDAALVREIAEETGLTVSLEGVAGASQHDMAHVRVVLLFMEARVRSGEIRLSGEHDAHRWVPREELAAMDLSDQLRPFVLWYLREHA